MRASSTSASRRRARSGWGRRRPPSRPRSSPATPISSRAPSSRRWPRPRAQANANGASADELERLYRLRKTCEGGIVGAELAEREDALENEILAARVDWKGEEMPLRTAQARLAVLDDYGERDELGELQAERVGAASTTSAWS